MKIKTIKLDIKGMTCDHCAQTIDMALNLPGVAQKEVSYKEHVARVAFDEELLSEEKIVEQINALGHYRVVGREEIAEKSAGKKHLIIIGGGSAAFAATIQAHELGARVTMINDGLPIGGTCVNVGCVPSKNLIRAAETLHKARHNPFSGIKTEGRLVNFKELIEQKRQLVQELRVEKYINVVKDMDDFRQITGRARITSPTSVVVNGETVHGDFILIASGARPLLPPVPGLKDVPYLTNEEAFELDELPESLIVLGGRYIALEIAQMFSRLGSEVTLLQRSDRILPNQTSDLTDALTAFLHQEGIRIVTGNQLQKVYEKDNQIVVESLVNGTLKKFNAQKIVVATGRRANTNDMGLEEVGVKLTETGFVEVNAFLQTSVANIFAAGDVLGENMFVYTAAYEGKLAAANALSTLKTQRDYTALPWVIFTDPQVAGVGPDELQAKEKGFDVEVTSLPLEHVPRCLAARDRRGFIKLIRDRNTDRLLGARILAPEGSELLMELALMIKFGIRVEQIKEMFHPYLTLSEGIKLAAISFSKDVKNLSCCAT